MRTVSDRVELELLAMRTAIPGAGPDRGECIGAPLDGRRIQKKYLRLLSGAIEHLSERFTSSNVINEGDLHAIQLLMKSRQILFTGVETPATANADLPQPPANRSGLPEPGSLSGNARGKTRTEVLRSQRRRGSIIEFPQDRKP